LESGNALIALNELATSVATASPQVIFGTESCLIQNGTVSSLGGNLEDKTACGFTTATDQQNVAILLGALADNGGPTLTHLITNTGFAHDRGVDALCAAAPVNGVDQRGITRPQVEQCDVGAVELELVPQTLRFFPQIYQGFDFAQ
jgi:hypothetical protein